MKRHYVSYISGTKKKMAVEVPEILRLDLGSEIGGELEDLDKKVQALIRYCELLTDILLTNESIYFEDLKVLSHRGHLDDLPITDFGELK